MELIGNSIQLDKIRLSYLGTFDENITTKLISISEFYLENRAAKGKFKNKVSYLIVECFQNIIRHGGAKDDPKLSHPEHTDFFQINVMEDRTILSSCNLIKTNNVEKLEQRLIELNSLGPDELKVLFKSVIIQKELTEKGGAGLGLIEMARKSGLPLKYSFKKLGEEFFEFFFSIEIRNTEAKLEEKFKITSIEQFYTKLLAEKVLMFYKGDLSKEIIIPVINMLQHNFPDQENLSSQEKRSLITLIETLQNVSKHAKCINEIKEGEFTIIKTQNGFVFEVGNYIEEGAYKKFEALLKSIDCMTIEEITALYKKRLIDVEISADGNCGLGLLEIARNSNKNYTYAFASKPDNDFFFTLKVTI